jgi:hypothetical protein
MRSLGNRQLDEGEVLCWKILSFLSLDSDMQAELTGPAGAWFFDIKQDKEGKANYLFGIALVYLHCHGTLRDRIFPQIANIDALTNIIRDMLERRNLDTWSISALNRNELWREVRAYATEVLNETGLSLNPPKKPFEIETLIEVDGYR